MIVVYCTTCLRSVLGDIYKSNKRDVHSSYQTLSSAKSESEVVSHKSSRHNIVVRTDSDVANGPGDFVSQPDTLVDDARSNNDQRTIGSYRTVHLSDSIHNDSNACSRIITIQSGLHGVADSGAQVGGNVQRGHDMCAGFIQSLRYARDVGPIVYARDFDRRYGDTRRAIAVAVVDAGDLRN